MGSGCPKCKAVEEIVRKAVEKLGIKAEVRHIYDINRIVEYGVMMTPAVAIDGKIVMEGKIPSIDEIERAIKGTG